jgi:phage gpG-like protein
MERHLNTIGNMTQNVIEESFDSERSPFGEVWKPLSFNTAKARYSGKTHKANGDNTKGFLRRWGAGAKNGKEKILSHTGNLGSSFTINATSNSVTVGTNVKYAAIHYFGGMAGRGKKVFINARPYLPIDTNGVLESNLEKIIIQFIEDKISSVCT